MGLGFLIHGAIRGQGLLRRKPTHAELCHRLQEAIFQAVPDPLQHRLLRFQAVAEGLDVTFHPAAEPVEFRLDEGEGLTASAKTSTVGPGYHAMLVELMETIGPAAGIDWNWSDQGDGEGDETGYRESRDFGALQAEMLTWLKGLGKVLLQEEGNFALSMPLHYGLVTEQFAYSPLGFWEREWFEALAIAEGERAESLAATFFPWWNHPADAAYWRDCGLVLAWIDLPWTPPLDEAEQRLYELTVDCFFRARKLDPDIGLPMTEIEEIRELLVEENEPLPPRPEGIGFRRGLRRFLFGDGWSLELPGHFRERRDKDDDLFVDGIRVVRCTSLAINSAGPDGKSAHDYVREMELDTKGQSHCDAFQEGALLGWGNEARSDRGDYWTFQACIGKDRDNPQPICFLTFSYDVPARDRNWAVQAFKSVQHQAD